MNALSATNSVQILLGARDPAIVLYVSIASAASKLLTTYVPVNVRHLYKSRIYLIFVYPISVPTNPLSARLICSMLNSSGITVKIVIIQQSKV